MDWTHLVSQHQHGLHAELPSTKSKQVLKRRTKKIHHEDIVVLLLAKPSAGQNHSNSDIYNGQNKALEALVNRSANGYNSTLN